MERNDSDKDTSEDDRILKTPRKGSKRRFPHSIEGQEEENHHRTKKVRMAGSSMSIADSVMMRRLGGTRSDPLNLLGTVKDSDQCSSCMSSPTQEAGQPPPPPPFLQRDPLNLEGTASELSALLKGEDKPEKQRHRDSARKHKRTRTLSTEEHVRLDEVAAASANDSPKTSKPIAKGSKYHYGNYDKYYGYRNGGMFEDDPRFSLLSKDMFKGKCVLDIGSNTGQVTVRIAKDFEPKEIIGIDIDNGLVKTAWKVLYRHFVPTLAPDGRQFPMSLTFCRGPLNIPPSPGGDKDKFPNNVHFVCGNFISDDCPLEQDKYDVILALSITKWIHLNWGDDGIKKFFQKVHSYLKDGGCLILEPQPFSSYKRKKRLTETIHKNYNSIQLQPSKFHDYLMSAEVGFAKHRLLGTTLNKSLGFRRPLHLYMKHGPDNPHVGCGTSCDQAVCSSNTTVT